MKDDLRGRHVRGAWPRALACSAAVLLSTACVEPHASLPPESASFAVCAVPAGGWSNNPDLTVGDVALDIAADFATATGLGVPPDGCFDGLAVIRSEASVNPLDAWWFAVNDALGRSWTLGIVLPGATLSDAVGAELSMTYEARAPNAGATTGSFELRDSAGKLAIWAVAANAVVDLATPAEVNVIAGVPVDSITGDCGTVEYLELAVELDGDSGMLPYGAQATLGGQRVFHGGLVLGTGSPGPCLDWAPNVASIAGFRVNE